MTSKNRVTVYVWPDGIWCLVEDVEQYAHKSDDYTKVTADADHIEEAVQAFIRI